MCVCVCECVQCCHDSRLDNGALLKTKIDHKGLLSALYEQRLSTGEKFVLSTQLDTLNIGGKAPKVGFALDLA